MKIRTKNGFSIQDRTKKDTVAQMSSSKVFISDSTSSNFNKYQERPLKTNQNDLSFKGSSVKSEKIKEVVKEINGSKIIESFKTIIGDSAAEHVKNAIEYGKSRKNPWMEVKDDLITFKPETFGQKIYQSIIDPIIHFPLDLVISACRNLKRFKVFENNSLINKILNNKTLKARSEYLTLYSNTMAIQHHAEMLQDKSGIGKMISEAQKRLNPEVANYTTKAERSLTRVFSGVIPAFFLANDAYNLSMYMNNNKDLAKKEKKRRFNQEIVRVGITAAATFATLGFFAKKSNASSDAATYIITLITLASEVLGRAITGVPFYPITSKQAKKYSQLEKTKDPEKAKKGKTIEDKEEVKSTGVLKLLAAITLAGFAIEKLPAHIKPIKELTSSVMGKYKSLFTNDYKISKQEFNSIVEKLKENGFDEIAKNFQKEVEAILNKGNLNAWELDKFNREVTKRAQKQISGFIIKDPHVYEEGLKELQKNISIESKKEILQQLNIKTRENEDVIHVGKFTNKSKFVMDQILLLPVRVVWDIINMPYRFVIKPLMELPVQIYTVAKKKDTLSKAEKELSSNEILQNSFSYLRKIDKSSNYKEKINISLLDSFDNVSKSNFSNAEIGGAAKTAVSTVTSAFLIFDNYNRVMIDSDGKDKKLAGQKAQERTIQRIVRIAYGASLIKLFGRLFSKPYNASLVGAQASNTAQSIITESLERASVGLPLHEATREEIIENDKKNVEATGIKGAYFKLIAGLTGKKPLSEIEN